MNFQKLVSIILCFVGSPVRPTFVDCLVQGVSIACLLHYQAGEAACQDSLYLKMITWPTAVRVVADLVNIFLAVLIISCSASSARPFLSQYRLGWRWLRSMTCSKNFSLQCHSITAQQPRIWRGIALESSHYIECTQSALWQGQVFVHCTLEFATDSLCDHFHPMEGNTLYHQLLQNRKECPSKAFWRTSFTILQ